ncbi:MAG: hypothetical protein EPN20_20335 [Magnetospirillum sp.]|nr:MAG: hypothetical protein EPN20_20335 [Magnetospirillum sp.]
MPMIAANLRPELDALRYDFAAEVLRNVLKDGWGVLALSAGVADAFTDQTGLSALGGATYDGVGRAIGNPFAVPATSYANPGGSGDRTATVAISSGSTGAAWTTAPTGALVDGATGGNDGHPNYTDALGNWVVFDFGAAAANYFSEFKIWQQTTNPAGADTWKFQGSNDNATWADITAAFGRGITNGLAIAANGNYGPWRYVRLICVGAGSTNDILYEVDFKLGTTPGAAPDITATSIAFVPAAATTLVRVVGLWEAVDAATLGTDCLLDVTADAGAHWSAVPLADLGKFDTSTRIIGGLAAVTAGSSISWRWRTANAKSQSLRGVFLQWK